MTAPTTEDRIHHLREAARNAAHGVTEHRKVEPWTVNSICEAAVSAVAPELLKEIAQLRSENSMLRLHLDVVGTVSDHARQMLAAEDGAK